MSNQNLQLEMPKLTTSAFISLYILDLTSLGGGKFYYYPGVDANSGPITFQGFTYTPISMEVRGFSFQSAGAPPRPSLIFANYLGAISALTINYNDLIGARVIRKRTFAKFLDNSPTADPLAETPEDHFFVERKVSENKISVEFELSSSLDVDDVSLPKRTIYSNLCGWKYRSSECSFAGAYPVADQLNNTPPGSLNSRGLWLVSNTYHENDYVYLNYGDVVRYFWCYFDNFHAGISGEIQGPPNGVFWKTDQCGKQIGSCQLRFGRRQLPHGGFPGTQRFPL